MVGDLKTLTDALRRDTPEILLQREIERRRGEITAALKGGQVLEICDVVGRVLRITTPRNCEFS